LKLVLLQVVRDMASKRTLKAVRATHTGRLDLQIVLDRCDVDIDACLLDGLYSLLHPLNREWL
jgi:hypothetical protein